MNETTTFGRHNFNEFCDVYYNEIFHYIRKQVDDTETAKDLTQDIFLKAYQKLHTYNEKKASMRTWIYRIAYNHVMNYFKSYYYKNKVMTDISYFDNLTSDQDILDYAIKQESVKEVLLAMKSCLNHKHLKIMNYYFFSDLSNNEISVELNIPVKTIRNVISLSIKKIQNELEERKNGL